jgi:hypothetical protein
MNRRTTAILTGEIALLALLVALIYTTRDRRAASNNPSQTNAPAAGAASAAASRDLTARPPKNETTEERRKRMISNEGYRDDLNLSEQDVYMYVQAKGSNALSLVTAFESTRDKNYLKAAAEKFPDDPFVQAKALLWLDMSDDERAKWTEAFKKSSPSNAFANFLAARDAVKRGDTQTAYAEVMAARGKGYDEFDRESSQGLGEAYLFAGRSEAEAKILGIEVTLPQYAEFKKVGHQFLDLAQKSADAGDIKTQQELLLANWQMGNQMRNGGAPAFTIAELVGIAIENLTLRSPLAGAEFNGRLTADLLAANTADSKELRSGLPVFENWFPTAPDEEIVTYFDMMVNSGERQAILWLKQQHPELAQIQPSN